MVTISFFGQSKEDFKVADKLFDEGNYIEGKEKFSTLLALDQTNADLNFKYGACLLYSEEDKLKGLGHLQYAIKDPTIDVRAYYFIGKAYHLNYRFEDAIKAYNKFKSAGSTKQYERLNVDQEIRMCNNGKKLLKNISELVVINKKEVVFNRLQYSYDLRNIGGKVLVTDEFQSSYDKKIGHRPLVHFPSTQQNNIFYSSYGKDGETGKDIYQIKKLPNGKWSNAQKLPVQVNTDSDEDYGFLHPDGMTFYFCSKGHSSMGGYDVFRCSYDSEYNTFGPAQNMDFKINTPDDDILYIVDSLNKEAYFASTRSSRGGYVDVYNVKVEIYPILNAIIAGRFQNDIDPNNMGVVIKVNDVIKDEIVGVYNSKSESGKFLIILPKSGRYQYIIESPQSDKVHTGLFEVPYQKELKPLKQEISLVMDGAEERLVINNLFDEEVENSELIMAEVLKQISDVEQNADKLEPLEDTTAVSAQDTLLGIINEEDLIALADTMAAQSAREMQEIKEKRDVAFFVANEKMKSARENAKKAEEILKGIDNVDNPQEKRQLIQLASEYHAKSQNDNEVATGALNLGNTLEEQYEKKKKEAEQSQIYANDIRTALNASSTEDAITKLEELKSYVEEARKLDVDDKSEFEQITAKAREKQSEATELMNKARQLRNDEDEIRQEIRNLETQYNSASKKQKPDIQIRIDEAKELLVQTEKDADKAFAFAKEVQKDADVLNDEAEVLERLFDDLADVEATELTEEEKTALSEEIQSGEIDASIESTTTVLAENQIEEKTETDTSSGPGQQLKDRVAAIMASKEEESYDSVRQALSELPDGPDKTARVNEANRVEAERLSRDIAAIDEALKSETDPATREQLETTIEELKVKETKLVEEIAQNDENNIAETETNTETSISVNEIGNKEEYVELSNRENAADQITDPIEKAREKENIANEWIDELAEDIEKMETLASTETDELKRTEYLDKAEELKLEKVRKEEERNEWMEIASTTSSEVNNSSETSSNESLLNRVDEEKYEDFETKASGLTTISNPISRASAEIELKNEWVESIEEDVAILNESYKEANENEKEEIQNEIDVLNRKKAELNDQIAESEEVIRSSSETEIASNTSSSADSSETSTSENAIEEVETVTSSENTIVASVEEFSYTDEKSYASEESEKVMDDLKDELEDLNAEQLELEALKIDLESDSEMSESKRSKLIAQIEKQEEKVLKKEIEVAESFVEINQFEKKELIEEIDNYKKEIEVAGGIDSIESLPSDEKVANVNRAFDSAKEMREKASQTQDDSTKSQLLKEASALEEAALVELKSLSSELNEVAANVRVEKTEDKTDVVDEVSTNYTPSTKENTPVEEIEETSLANLDSFNSSTSQEKLAEVSDQLEDINEYDTEIEILEMEKEQADEKETKKLDKKISKIEKKRAKIELKVAPEIAQANELEFNQSKSLNESLTSDINSISTNDRSNSTYTDAINYRRVAERQFDEAQTIRENASSIKDAAAKNDSLKKANTLEKLAIRNMAAANSMNMKAAEVAALNVYPADGNNDFDQVNDKLTKQRTLAATLLSEGNDMIMQAKVLSDSAQVVKNEEEKNRLLAESEEMQRTGEQKKQLSTKLNSNADEVETRIKDDQTLASLTDESVKEVRKSPEYKEAHMQFLDRLDRIENSIKNGESLVPQLRSSAEQDKLKAAELNKRAAESEDEQEKQNLLSQAIELEQLASAKLNRADSVESDLDELEFMKEQVVLAQNDYLEAMPNQELASMIKAVGRSNFDKAPLSPGELDISEIGGTNFEAPDKIEEDIVSIDNSRESSSYSEENPIPINPKMPEGLVYRVQVGAFSRPIPQDLFKGFTPLTGEVIRNNITRYRVGYFTRYQNANSVKNQVRGLGFDDAFVVAIYNGESIRISEARRLEVETLGEAPVLAANDNSRTSTNTNAESSSNNSTANSNTASTTTSNNSNSENSSSTTSNSATAGISYYEELENAPNAQPVESLKGLFYTVQIGAFSKKVTGDDLFNIQPLNVNLTSGGLLRYSTGRYREIPAASLRKDEVRRIGVRDAFVTVYYNGKRTTFSEARNLIEQFGDGVFSDGGGGTNPNDDENGDSGSVIEGLEYIIDIGTYDGSVPTEIAEILLPHSDIIVRKFLDETTLQLTSGPLNTIQSARSRKQLLDKQNVLEVDIKVLYQGKEITMEEAEQLENR
ncbi:MAG: hypothetical protein CL833_15525 [Crocinitomicaceae bacterium]|nr:hypothetical protein [Crocinitomicaceae bacterium]